MAMQMRDFLPESWWEVADCVDTYDAVRKEGFPDLRELVKPVSAASKTAALAELAAVDMEYRWETGQPKTVERYLREYPEIVVDGQYPEDLIAQEYQVRCERGEEPPISEYRRRFPDYDVDRIISRVDTCMFSGSSATHKSREKPPDPPPETIGRYRVVEELGAGAFGRVWRFYDPELKREVAIKIAHGSTKSTAEQEKGFLHEARSAARLQHSGIVSVLDTGQLDDGRGYVVYEFVAGQTLRDRIKRGAYTREEAIRWCAEIADALHYAHMQKIVHRDVSPGNVLIDRQGHARLTDFGLAKMDDLFFRDDHGKVLGSLAYISPEQARGDSHWASPQSDVYSLGVILYELLAGRRPFRIERSYGLPEILEQIQRRVADPPRTVDDTISKPLEDICLKAMAKDPAQRYTTATDMAAALRKTAGVAPRPWRRNVFFGATGLVAVALLVMAALRQEAVNPTVDEPELSVTLLRHGKQYDFINTDGLPPVRSGDRLHLFVDLAEKGYVYLFAGFPDGRLELLADPEKQVAEFTYPNEAGKQWLEVTPEQEDGPEMLLLAVADQRLDKSQLEEIASAGFFPSGKFRGERRFGVLEVPVPISKRERGYEITSLSEDAFGPALSEKLGVFRAYRANVYVHHD